MIRQLADEGRYPWPVLAVAAHGLPGVAGRSFPERPLSDERWRSVVAAAHQHRLSGLLLAAIDAGALPSTATQAEEARTLHRVISARVMALERALIGVVDLLMRARIESRVLKGSAVAHLDYARPVLRPFIDLDVLVRTADIDRALQVLANQGFVRTHGEPRPGFDRRFEKGVTLVGPAGYELDLHRTFVLGPWGLRVGLAELWEDAEDFEVGGHRLRALSSTHRFIHACYHAALGDWPPRLVSLRDVLEMTCNADGEASDRLGLANRWGVQAVVATAVADSNRLLGFDSDDELSRWARGYVPSRRDKSCLALHRRPDKTFTAQALATLRELPRPRDKAAYARALLLPDEGYTAGRHASTLSRLRYGVREALRGRAQRSMPEIFGR